MTEIKKVATAMARNRDTGRLLILKRSADMDVNPGKWNFPSGKIEDGETPREAALRELREETGLSGELIEQGSDFLAETEDGAFRVYPFLVEIEGEPELNKEHTKYEWTTPENLGDFDSVEGLERDAAEVDIDEAVQGDVALAVVEKRDGKFLMLKRAEDQSSAGKWTFPAGRVEEDESEREAALRELEEEAGLEGRIIDSGESFLNDEELGIWRVHPFLVEEEGKVELNEEHSEYRWLKEEEIEDLEILGDLEALDRLELK